MTEIQFTFLRSPVLATGNARGLSQGARGKVPCAASAPRRISDYF
jgi:hypothetical protein